MYVFEQVEIIDACEPSFQRQCLYPVMLPLQHKMIKVEMIKIKYESNNKANFKLVKLKLVLILRRTQEVQ